MAERSSTGYVDIGSVSDAPLTMSQFASSADYNQALQERYDFVLAACRDALDAAARYGWALHDIAQGKADPVGIARAALLGRAAGVAIPDGSRDALDPARGEVKP